MKNVHKYYTTDTTTIIIIITMEVTNALKLRPSAHLPKTVAVTKSPLLDLSLLCDRSVRMHPCFLQHN